MADRRVMVSSDRGPLGQSRRLTDAKKFTSIRWALQDDCAVRTLTKSAKTTARGIPLTLAILFFVTALTYASVGFGGGSTYNALLVLDGVNYALLPIIALSCNIIVVTGNVIRQAMAKLISISAMAPLVVASAPAAWLGGRLPVSETVFVTVLGLALLISGTQLMLARESYLAGTAKNFSVAALCGISAGVGLLAGITGIGGGVFLAPILLHLSWSSPQRIAAASSVFILVNSLFGLLGQATKLHNSVSIELLADYWTLPLAVLLGGQIGSWLTINKYSAKTIKKLTAVLVIVAGCRLLWSLV